MNWIKEHYCASTLIAGALFVYAGVLMMTGFAWGLVATGACLMVTAAALGLARLEL